MPDLLTPIRRLYAVPPDTEGGGEPDHMTHAQEAEFAALRPVREALDNLPRSRPPADLIDETVARATFAAVRSVYGETDRDSLPTEAAREAAYLGSVSEALGQLPSERPDEEVVDAVVARAVVGDVRSAYDEHAPARLPAEVAREAAALASMKQALDRLPRQAPDPELIDRVVAMAATTEASRKRRTRRPAAPPRGARRVRRRIGGLVGALAGLVFVGLATLWVVQTGGDAEMIAETDMPAAVTPPPVAEERVQALPEPREEPMPEPQAEAPRAVAMESRALPPPVVTGESARTRAPAESFATHLVAAPIRPTSHTPLPTVAVDAEPDVSLTLTGFETDDDEALRLLYLRLQALRASGMDWGEPEVILGAPPAAKPAAVRGWMQVRIER